MIPFFRAFSPGLLLIVKGITDPSMSKSILSIILDHTLASPPTSGPFTSSVSSTLQR